MEEERALRRFLIPVPGIHAEVRHPATRAIYYVLQWTWGILQNICGLCLYLFIRFSHPEFEKGRANGAFVTRWDNPASMGLGMFIFFGHSNDEAGRSVLVHEYGHTIQSALLGPFFLPVIGIPSFIWANLPSCRNKRLTKGVNYYTFYPENWANVWGEKVTRLPSPYQKVLKKKKRRKTVLTEE